VQRSFNTNETNEHNLQFITFIKKTTHNKTGLFLTHYLLTIINFAFFFILLITRDYEFDYYRPSYSLHKKIIIAIIAGPLFETLIFQFIPNKILDILKIRNYYIQLFLMALLFAIAHRHFQIPVFINFFIGGSIVVNYYLQVEKRESTKNAIIKTFVLHAVFNLTLTIITLIPKIITFKNYY